MTLNSLALLVMVYIAPILMSVTLEGSDLKCSSENSTDCECISFSEINLALTLM